MDSLTYEVRCVLMDLILCTNGHTSRCYVQDLVGIGENNPYHISF